MKAIPLDRKELMRGGGSVLGMTKNNAAAFHMCATTEIAELDRRMRLLKPKLTMLINQDGKVSEGFHVINKEYWELKFRQLRVRHELDKCTDFHSLFYSRARKLLPSDQFDTLLRMAQADVTELSESITVEHEVGGEYEAEV